MSNEERSDSGGDTESLHDESNDEGHEAGVVERVFASLRGCCTVVEPLRFPTGLHTSRVRIRSPE